MANRFSQPKTPHRETPAGNGYQPVQTYTDLRTMVFSVDLGALGSRKTDTVDHVWGIVMETGYSQAVATLLALADGTVNLYFSSGGGMIGLGDYQEVGEAGQRLIALAAKFVTNCDMACEFPLPRKGFTRFYLMTYSGVLSLEVDAEGLWQNAALAPLFDRGHKLLAMIRSIGEQQAVSDLNKASLARPN